MNREELKRLWFSIDHSNVEEKRIITVKLGTGKYWRGYGDVAFIKEGPDGYSHFSTHQENPIQYALDSREYKTGKYKLIVK